MSHADFLTLSAELQAVTESDPFGTRHTELHNRYVAELDRMFNDAEFAAQMEAMEADAEASEDYRHTCHYASY